MATNDRKDVRENRETYDSFMSVTKWSIILIVGILVVLAAVFVR